jgi:integrase
LSGFGVRVQKTGTKAYVAVSRDPSGKQHWVTLGSCDALPIEEARQRARSVLVRIRDGLPAIQATFEAVAESWRERHVLKNGLRSEPEISRLLRVHVYPRWKGREFLSIKRSDVAALLDHVEDQHSARQADYVLNVVRSVMNWHATRADDYSPPISRGMRRQSPSAQARARILDDEEIRLIWRLAASFGTFGAIVKICLLTAQRRSKVAAMKWGDLSDAGEWAIPTEPREKGTGGTLVLSKPALEVIRAQPRIGDSPFVFVGRGDGPFAGLAQAKARFDARLSIAPWVLHDLRRTSRSLMARAGIQSEIAERVLGHVQGGIAGVYNRHDYISEKAEALKRLAALIEEIVEPSANVVPLQRAV